MNTEKLGKWRTLVNSDNYLLLNENKWFLWEYWKKILFQLTCANAHQTGGPVWCSDSVNPPRLPQACQLVPTVMRSLAQVCVVAIDSLYLGHLSAVTSRLPLTATLHQAHLKQTTKYSDRNPWNFQQGNPWKLLRALLCLSATPLSKKELNNSVKTFKLPLTNRKLACFSCL